MSPGIGGLGFRGSMLNSGLRVHKAQGLAGALLDAQRMAAEPEKVRHFCCKMGWRGGGVGIMAVVCPEGTTLF